MDEIFVMFGLRLFRFNYSIEMILVFLIFFYHLYRKGDEILSLDTCLHFKPYVALTFQIEGVRTWAPTLQSLQFSQIIVGVYVSVSVVSGSVFVYVSMLHSFKLLMCNH